MKKSTILLGIASSLFLSNLLRAQEIPSNEDLLKRIEALEAEKAKPKEWDASLYGWVRTEYNSIADNLLTPVKCILTFIHLMKN